MLALITELVQQQPWAKIQPVLLMTGLIVLSIQESQTSPPPCLLAGWVSGVETANEVDHPPSNLQHLQRPPGYSVLNAMLVPAAE